MQILKIMNLQNNLCKIVYNPTNNQLSYFGLISKNMRQSHYK